MKLLWFFLIVVFCALCVCGYWGQVQPKVITEIEYIPQYIEVTKEVEVVREVYPTEFRQFNSQEELSQWQAEQYLEIRALGKQNNWFCVDYALELQRRAWLEGYQMSVELLIDGDTGHAICSTWIGDECIFLEPQNTESWVGGVKGSSRGGEVK